MTQIEWPARIWARLRPRIKSFFYGIGVWGICGIAIRYRPALSDITIVGITGSAGKTTAKKYVTAILSKLEPTKGNFGTQNSPVETSLFLLKQRRKYKCLVQELGIGDAPGDIPRAVKILRPSIGAVTNIGHDHYRLFRSLEAIAEEKASLVRCLPRDGVAVLNIDDPLVRPMAALSPAKVIFFGASEEADIRMSDITGTWPEHFGMTVSYQSHSVRVTTKLVGRQWAPTILAAIGIGLARGLTLDDCAAAIAEVEPEFNRLTEKTVPDGAHFLLDAFKAPFWSIGLAFDVMESARARRKVIVLGTMSHMHGNTKSKYRNTVRDALRIADLVVFTGPLSNTVRKGLPPEDLARLHIFKTVYEANEFLKDKVAEGDLVLLKGSAGPDHLERVYLDQIEQIACWREHCGRKGPCITCWRQRRPYLPKQSSR